MTRYEEALRDALGRIETAYLLARVPARQPVWWKRLLHRPHYAVDPDTYMAYLNELLKPPWPHSRR